MLPSKILIVIEFVIVTAVNYLKVILIVIVFAVIKKKLHCIEILNHKSSSQSLHCSFQHNIQMMQFQITILIAITFKNSDMILYWFS